jgi:hypothetical protein
LWRTAGDWVKNRETWLNGWFNDINAKNTEDEVTSGVKLMFKTIRNLTTQKQNQEEELADWNMNNPDEENNPPFDVIELDGIINIATQVKKRIGRFQT